MTTIVQQMPLETWGRDSAIVVSALPPRVRSAHWPGAMAWCGGSDSGSDAAADNVSLMVVARHTADDWERIRATLDECAARPMDSYEALAQRCFPLLSQDVKANIARARDHGSEPFAALAAAVRTYYDLEVLPRDVPDAEQRPTSADAIAAAGDAWFFERLLPFLVEQAGCYDREFPSLALPVVDVDCAATVTLTRRQCLCVLAMTFLGVDPQPSSAPPLFGDAATPGRISWLQLFQSRIRCGIHRVICQLHYFDVWHTHRDDVAGTWGSEEISFSRRREVRFPKWANVDSVPVVAPLEGDAASPFATLGVLPSKRLIEQYPEAGAHVDFANRQIMIGKLIPSCTQEEVMFTVRPELFLTLPLFTTVQDHEVVVVRGALIFCEYTGYLDTFQFAAPRPQLREGPPPEVLVLDAHVNRGSQFEPRENKRDLDKAWLGFSSMASTVVATGPWGCGAFNGDTTLKFLQQLMAAAACEPRRYLCYHHQVPEFCTAAAEALQYLRVPIGTAHLWINEYSRAARQLIYGGRPSQYMCAKVVATAQQQLSTSLPLHVRPYVGALVEVHRRVQMGSFADFLIMKLIAAMC